MNRSYKITIVIILFLAALFGMVYYAIDARKKAPVNTSASSLISQNKDEVIVTLPSGTYENFEQGSIEFLRNDGKSMDVLIPFTLNKLNKIVIPKISLAQGLYKVRINWINDHKDYYREEDLFVE